MSPATKQSLINSLERDVQILLFGIALANSRDELRNGRAEMIRATGAVLIASVLLYLCLILHSTPTNSNLEAAISQPAQVGGLLNVVEWSARSCKLE